MNDSPSVVRQVRAVVAILLVTAIWGFSFILVKKALQDIALLYFLLFRFLLAALVLAFILRDNIKMIDRYMLKAGFWAGLTLFIGFVLQSSGLIYTNVSNVAFITGIYVVLVPLINCCIKRRLDLPQIGVGVLTLLGLFIFSVQSSFSVNRGDFIVLSAAFAFAMHFLIINKYGREIDSLLLTFIQISFAAIFCAVTIWITRQPLDVIMFNQQVLLALLYCALFSTALAYYIQTAVQKVLSATQTAVIFTTECVFGAFFGWLIFNELFTTRKIIGSLILLACMVVALLLPKMQNKSRLN